MDRPHRLWRSDTLEPSFSKRPETNLFESIREVNSSETPAAIKGLSANYFQQTTRLFEFHFRQAPATVERAGLYLTNTRRNCHALDATTCEPIISNFLNALRNSHVPERPQVPEKLVAGPRVPAEYLYVGAYESAECKGEPILNPDCSDVRATYKGCIFYFPERAWQ